MHVTKIFEHFAPSRLFGGASEAFRRFPISMLCAFLVAGFGLYLDDVMVASRRFDEQVRFQEIFLHGILLAACVQYYSEARGWPFLVSALLSVVLLAVLGLAILFSPHSHFWEPGGGLTLLLPGFTLLLMVAPFLARARDDLQFWYYCKSLGLRIGFSLLAALALAGGLSAAFGALEQLFDINLNGAYSIVWILCLYLLWPWIALAGAPRVEGAEPDSGYPKSLRFLCTYIFIPLVLAYLAIIYLYLGTILVRGELPDGEVGFLVSIYGSFGVAVHLLIFPLRKEGPIHLRLFYRYFYWALFIPLALLIFALYLRVDSYGVTEARYILGLFAAWLCLIGVFIVLSAGKRILVVPLTLSVLLVTAAFGPWGATGLSTSSQLGRIEAIFAKHGILENNRVSPPSGDIPWEDAKNISSVLRYLTNKKEQDQLRVWFAEANINWNHYSSYDSILEALGIEEIWEQQGRPAFRFSHPLESGDQSTALDVRQFDWAQTVYMSHTSGGAEDTLSTPVPGKEYKLSFIEENNSYLVSSSDGKEVAFDIGALASRLRSMNSEEERAAAMTLEARQENLQARLRLTSIYGVVEDGKVKIQNAQGWLFIAD